MANVLVWATGLAGIALATSWAWRWRALPVVAERPAPDGRGQAALEGLRTVALSLWAGLAAGFLVPGCDLQRYVARFSQRYVAAPVVSLKGSAAGAPWPLRWPPVEVLRLTFDLRNKSASAISRALRASGDAVTWRWGGNRRTGPAAVRGERRGSPRSPICLTWPRRSPSRRRPGTRPGSPPFEERLSWRSSSRPRGRVSCQRPRRLWSVVVPRRVLSSRTPTSSCRCATAGRRGRAREWPPRAGHAATGTRVALRRRPRLPGRQHVRP